MCVRNNEVHVLVSILHTCIYRNEYALKFGGPGVCSLVEKPSHVIYHNFCHRSSHSEVENCHSINYYTYYTPVGDDKYYYYHKLIYTLCFEVC